MVSRTQKSGLEGWKELGKVRSNTDVLNANFFSNLKGNWVDQTLLILSTESALLIIAESPVLMTKLIHGVASVVQNLSDGLCN